MVVSRYGAKGVATRVPGSPTDAGHGCVGVDHLQQSVRRLEVEVAPGARRAAKRDGFGHGIALHEPHRSEQLPGTVLQPCAHHLAADQDVRFSCNRMGWDSLSLRGTRLMPCPRCKS